MDDGHGVWAYIRESKSLRIQNRLNMGNRSTECINLAGPQSLVVMLSRRCNLSCSYCIEGTKDGKTVISFDNVVKQLRQLDNGSVVEFTGGEPLLHTKLIARILDWACEQERDYLWVLTTNGSLLPSEQFVKNYLTRFHLVRLSVDGPREHHDLHRGVGSFDRAMRFLKMLHQRGYQRISLNPTFTKHTIKQLLSSSQWFLNIQKRYKLLRLNLSLNVADRVDWNEDDLRAYELELERTLHWYEAISESDKKYFSLSCLERAGRPSFNLYEYLAVCPAGINVFALSPVGEILPCVTDLFEDVKNDQSVLQSFSGDSEYRRLALERDYPDCFECDRYQCSPCPSLFKIMTGDARKIPKNYCRFGKVTDYLVNRFLKETKSQVHS